jgi:probable non-F420 flavinoid oxidoreductase
MAEIGYQASHEQFSPSELLKLAVMAEQAGFQAINSSDHFFPWSKRQGQSGYSFAWMGAAMQATTIPHGVVCAPGYRNNPAIVAQAIATLCEMFPERFWISLGSGEAINESITGERWPIKQERNERLLECYHIIKSLLKGETVTHHGRVVVEQAKLYTLPRKMPLLIGAAVTAETAEWVGGWADGLITVHKPIDELRKVVQAFRQGGGEYKPMYLKVQLSYASNEKDALDGAYDQWRSNILPSNLLGDLTTVSDFDAIGQFIRPDDLHGSVNISADPDRHADLIKEYIDLGFERIILHNVNRDQETFIRDFGEKVLPKFS